MLGKGWNHAGTLFYLRFGCRVRSSTTGSRSRGHAIQSKQSQGSAQRMPSMAGNQDTPSDPSEQNAPNASGRWLNRNVWGMGLASLLTDASHEMATSVFACLFSPVSAASRLRFGARRRSGRRPGQFCETGDGLVERPHREAETSHHDRLCFDCRLHGLLCSGQGLASHFCGAHRRVVWARVSEPVAKRPPRRVGLGSGPRQGLWLPPGRRHRGRHHRPPGSGGATALPWTAVVG